MISVIIPTYNEADQIGVTIHKLGLADRDNLITEIIVADGSSSDDTLSIAKQAGAKTAVMSVRGRAALMNYGASLASSGILYFLHADSVPPIGFSKQVVDAYQQGFKSGCFRLAFNNDHWFLKANAWFTRFNVNAVRFGDQSLYVGKSVFEKAGLFREDLLLLEDQEIIHRLKKFSCFKVLNDVVTTSARKYVDNGIYRMQGIFFRIWLLYYLGRSQKELLQLHRKLIRKNKL